MLINYIELRNNNEKSIENDVQRAIYLYIINFRVCGKWPKPWLLRNMTITKENVL